MYGTLDELDSRNSEDLRNKLNPTGKKEIDELIQQVSIDAARTYLGPYSREVMEVALKPLVRENKNKHKINCSFLVRLIKNADAKKAKPIIVKIEGRKEKVYLRASEINSVLRTFERMNILTRNFWQDKILWVCQEQPSGSYYSCLTILHSSHSFLTQLYFSEKNGGEMARDFAKAFAADRWLSSGENVYLKEVANALEGSHSKDLAILKCV